MTNILILKLGATGDVVRTTPLLKHLAGEISWITAGKNVSLLDGITKTLRCVPWEQREQFCDREYDLVINLEDTSDVAQFLPRVRFKRLFGACIDKGGALVYTDDARGWFDLSLISRFGKAEADRLKLENRRTYQDLIFSGLGLKFQGEKYLLPEPARTSLAGDVAIAPKAGHVWPMKNWAYYAELKTALEKRGLTVNVLPETKACCPGVPRSESGYPVFPPFSPLSYGGFPGTAVSPGRRTCKCAAAPGTTVTGTETKF